MQSWSNYGRDYYYSHKEEFRAYQRKYLAKNKKMIIYKVISQDDEILYFGSASSRFRMNYHYTHNSKLDMKNRDWKMMYSEIEGVTREELYYIEYYLIAKHNNPRLNDEKPSLERFSFSEERKKELTNIGDNLQFNTFILEQ